MLQKNFGVAKKMISGTQYKQRDILLVPFPFSDLTETKQRPVLVLSKDIYNQSSEDIVTCGITSNLLEKKFAITITQKDLDEGFLIKTSNIRVDKLFTLEKSIVRKKIGKISQKTFEKVKEEFFRIM